MSDPIIKFRDLNDLTSPPLTVYQAFPKLDTSGRGSYFIATTEDNSFSCYSGALSKGLKSHILSFHTFAKKEHLYITAISNLNKKIDYLHLTMQIDQNLISEDDFDYEIETNEDRYLIHSNNNFKDDDFEFAVSVVNKIPHRKFTSDELSEMFSIPFEKVNNLLVIYESSCKFLER